MSIRRGHYGLMVRRCWAAEQKGDDAASIMEEAMSDRNGGKPPLDEILDALKEIYLTLRHSSRSKRTLRQAGVLKRVFIVLEDCAPCRALDADKVRACFRPTPPSPSPGV